MCLTVPVKVIEIKDNKAIVDSFGELKEVGIQLVDDIKIGDYAIISNGFLISRMEASEAEKILNLLQAQEKEGK